MAWDTLEGAGETVPNLQPETDCVPLSSFLSSHVQNRHLLLPLGCTFFLPPPPFSLSPLSVALVLKTQSLIVHSFSSTNFYTCSSRNTTLLVFPWR